MNILEAKEIAKSLGNGIDPTTGEILSSDSVLNNPTIVRALLALAHEVPTKEEARILRNAGKNLPENTGKKWDEQTDQEVTSMFEQGQPIKEIAEHLKRTKGSIRSRLIKLGLIEDDTSKS